MTWNQHRSCDDYENLLASAQTRDEVIAIKLKIDDSMRTVSSQLAEARREFARTRVYSDPDWFRRANNAQRWLATLSQKAQLKLHELKVSYQKTLAEKFVDIARSRLDSATFESIRREAQEAVRREALPRQTDQGST